MHGDSIIVHSLRFEVVEINFWTACHAFSLHHQVFALYGLSQTSITLKACEINAVMKERTIIVLEFFSDQG